MRSFIVSLVATILAFVCGIVTASSWNENSRKVFHPTIIERCPETTYNSPPSPVATPAPIREVIFGDGLRIVPENVRLKSELLRYDITLRYPQIIGANDLHIRKLNQHLKQLATKQYQGMLSPSKKDLRQYQEEWPATFNTFTMDYDIIMANNSFLSIYLYGYSFGIGAESVQQSHAVNYDFASGKELKLSDMFKRGSNYLELISSYCKEQFSEEYGPTVMSNPALAPRPENFKTWNLTRRGITLNFDGCKLFNCAYGDKTIEIPFSALENQLNFDNL